MNKLLDTFSALGYVNESNDEIIAYGLQRIRDFLIDIMGVIICGIIMRNLLASMVFEVFYIPLRVYAGGYHASNEKKCAYLSWGSIVLSLAVISYLPIPMRIQHLLMVLSAIIIFFLAPLESANKPLMVKEKEVFRRRSIMIVLTEEIIYSLAVLLNSMICAKAICIALALVAVGVILGKDYTSLFKKYVPLNL